MRALESSPVHCLNPRPSGKRRNPGKDGADAILQYHLYSKPLSLVGTSNSLPAVNICHNHRSLSFPVSPLKIYFDPSDQMVFERSLDYLMQEIR